MEEVSLQSQNESSAEAMAVPYGIDPAILAELEKNRELRQMVSQHLDQTFELDMNANGYEKMVQTLTAALEPLMAQDLNWQAGLTPPITH